MNGRTPWQFIVHEHKAERHGALDVHQVLPETGLMRGCGVSEYCR